MQQKKQNKWLHKIIAIIMGITIGTALSACIRSISNRIKSWRWKHQRANWDMMAADFDGDPLIKHYPDGALVDPPLTIETPRVVVKSIAPDTATVDIVGYKHLGHYLAYLASTLVDCINIEMDTMLAGKEKYVTDKRSELSYQMETVKNILYQAVQLTIIEHHQSSNSLYTSAMTMNIKTENDKETYVWVPVYTALESFYKYADLVNALIMDAVDAGTLPNYPGVKYSDYFGVGAQNRMNSNVLDSFKRLMSPSKIKGNGEGEIIK